MRGLYKGVHRGFCRVFAGFELPGYSIGFSSRCIFGSNDVAPKPQTPTPNPKPACTLALNPKPSDLGALNPKPQYCNLVNFCCEVCRVVNGRHPVDLQFQPFLRCCTISGFWAWGLSFRISPLSCTRALVDGYFRYLT